jgi:hypothetical protein
MPDTDPNQPGLSSHTRKELKHAQQEQEQQTKEYSHQRNQNKTSHSLSVWS